MLFILTGCLVEVEPETNEDDQVAQPVELTQAEKIKAIAEEIISDFSAVTIKEIKVNEHHEDGYIALVYLSFDRKNRASTAKEMIKMFNNDLGVRMAGTDELVELTTFWEVPYLLEGENIAKANMEQKEGKMYMVEEWFNGNIFN